MSELAPPDAALNDARIKVIYDSYQMLTGRCLIASFDPLAMWNAPCAIVAHGTQADPIFFYANRLALLLFEMSFAEFVCLPSRLSAEPLAQEERIRLLAKVTQQGFVDDYCGMHIAKNGNRFMISNATVWNLSDPTGKPFGQAASFVV
jgi:MEKHLA domain